MTVFERAHRVLQALALLACVALPAAAVAASEETRVALVIGNGAYRTAPLANPVRDAQTMAQALRTMGFTVIEREDVGKVEFEQLVAQARQLLDGKHGVGMLYFAGHGMQLDWRNYMIPVDARLATRADVPEQAVAVDAVVDAFRSAGTRANIVVLDACRDNPFGAAAGKGLAAVEAPSGSVFAYATAPGSVAADGDPGSGNGLYTQFLVREMARPGARIEDVFKRVRFQVRQLSRGRQIPWESTSLEGDFFFRPLAAGEARGADSGEQALRQELADWKQIQNSIDPDDVYRFLVAHPSGSLSEVALARLERLDKAPPPAAVGATTGRRYRLGDVYEFVQKDFVTGEQVRRYRWKVTAIEGDLVRINDGAVVMTQSGAEVKSGDAAFDPPYSYLPVGEFRIGDVITSRTRHRPAHGASEWREYVTRVVSYEKVTIGAGTFMAFRLESVMTGEYGAAARGVYWVDPAWGAPLRSEWTGRNPHSGEGWGWIREAVSRRRGAEPDDAAAPVAPGATLVESAVPSRRRIHAGSGERRGTDEP
jgi:hypothetical protein